MWVRSNVSNINSSVGIILLVFWILLGLILNSTPKSYPKAGDTITYNITSSDGKIRGVVGITYTGREKITAFYHLRLDDALQDNWVCKPKINSCQRSVEYSYVVNLKNPEDVSADSDGMLSAVYCNKDFSVNNPFSSFSEFYAHSCGLESSASNMKTNSFYWNMQTTFSSVDELKKYTVLDLYDGSKFWRVEDEQGNSLTHAVDMEKAVSSGYPTKNYKLIYSK